MDNFETKIIIPPESIDDAKEVRRQVFQKEQGIEKNLDFDGDDNTAIHVVVYKDKKPLATSRIRFLNNKEKAKVERVAVLSSMRGLGIGKLVMSIIDNYLKEEKVLEVFLDSQLSAKEFYKKLGYTQEGEVFEEVGIPHVKMVKHY